MPGISYADLKKQRNLAFAALRALGMEPLEIAEVTGVSYWTVWRATKDSAALAQGEDAN